MARRHPWRTGRKHVSRVGKQMLSRGDTILSRNLSSSPTLSSPPSRAKIRPVDIGEALRQCRCLHNINIGEYLPQRLTRKLPLPPQRNLLHAVEISAGTNRVSRVSSVGSLPKFTLLATVYPEAHGRDWLLAVLLFSEMLPLAVAARRSHIAESRANHDWMLPLVLCGGKYWKRGRGSDGLLE